MHLEFLDNGICSDVKHKDILDKIEAVSEIIAKGLESTKFNGNKVGS